MNNARAVYRLSRREPNGTLGCGVTAGIPKGREPACTVVWEPGLAYWVSLRPPDWHIGHASNRVELFAQPLPNKFSVFHSS